MSLSLTNFQFFRNTCIFKNYTLHCLRKYELKEIKTISKRSFKTHKGQSKKGRGNGIGRQDLANKVDSRGFKDLIKPFGFTIMFSGCSFVGCAVWQYETIRSFMHRSVQDQIVHFNVKSGSFRNHVNFYWNQLTSGQKAAASIIGVNIAVYLAWKIRPLQGIMVKFFLSDPLSNARCLPLLLSAFSHYSFLHLAANMYVLWSFTPSITHLLGREQFVAMYLSAAVISGFTSYMFRVARGSKLPSLGASGAIFAVLGAACTHYPDAQLSILLIDQILPHKFKAEDVVYGIIALDVTGCLFGWKYLDHAGHLGGMLFGLWYAKYGYKLIWNNREPLIKKWHVLREKT